jgi:F-box-like
MLSTHFLFLPNEILSLVTTFLPIKEIYRLGLTCKHLHHIAKREIRHRYNINKFLSRYVDDPERFRRLMCETGAIIVGDVASAFFAGDERPKEIVLLCGNQDIHKCLHSWISFFGIDAVHKYQCSYIWFEKPCPPWDYEVIFTRSKFRFGRDLIYG